MVKRIMRSFKMNEISAVDKPAQEGARALIMKRADDRVARVAFTLGDNDDLAAVRKYLLPTTELVFQDVAKDMYGVSRFAELIQSIDYLAQSSEREREDEGDGSPVPAALRSWLATGTNVFRAMADEEVRELVAAVTKRKFTAAERKTDAKSGAAMPDGSFPIKNAGDLANAMRLAGHAKDPAKARAHIKARAKALGLTSRLSDAYKRGDTMLGKAIALFKSFGTAKDGLAESIKSIVEDPAATDKPALIDATIKQFSEHVEDTLEKALSEGESGDTSEEDEMSAALKKALGLADTASEADVLAAIGKKDAEHALALDIVKAAMSDDEKSYHDKIADVDAQKKFRGMSKNDRASLMVKRDDLPPAIAKALQENEDLKKQVAALVAKDELATFVKRAAEMGVPEAKADVLRKAAAGDKVAVEEVFAMLKLANTALDNSDVLKELGSTRSDTGDEMDALKAKAAELRKSDPKLTEEQAFAKVYADPANRKIAAAERRKNRPAA